MILCLKSVITPWRLVCQIFTRFELFLIGKSSNEGSPKSVGHRFLSIWFDHFVKLQIIGSHTAYISTCYLQVNIHCIIFSFPCFITNSLFKLEVFPLTISHIFTHFHFSHTIIRTDVAVWPQTAHGSMIIWWRCQTRISNATLSDPPFPFELWRFNFHVPARCSRWLGLSNHRGVGQLDAWAPADRGATDGVIQTGGGSRHPVSRWAGDGTMSRAANHSNQWKVRDSRTFINLVQAWWCYHCQWCDVFVCYLFTVCCRGWTG